MTPGTVPMIFSVGKCQGHDFPKPNVETYQFGQVYIWRIQGGGLLEKAGLVLSIWGRHRGILLPMTASDLIRYR